jgi:hypothetical protein
MQLRCNVSRPMQLYACHMRLAAYAISLHAVNQTKK